MAGIQDRPEARNMLYEKTRELHKKDIVDFKEQFICKSREISYKEREEYYTLNHVKPETIQFIEGLPAYFVLDGTYDIDFAYEYDKQFGNLFNWFQSGGKDWNLTKVWLYSLGREESLTELDVAEKVFLLDTLLKNNIIGNHSGLYAGEENCKLLGIIMNIPWLSIESPLKSIYKNEFMNFQNMEAPSAGKKKKRLDKIIKTLMDCEVNKRIINLLDPYLDNFRDKFE